VERRLFRLSEKKRRRGGAVRGVGERSTALFCEGLVEEGESLRVAVAIVDAGEAIAAGDG